MDKFQLIINKATTFTIKCANKIKIKTIKITTETLVKIKLLNEKVKLFTQKSKSIKTTYNPILIELSKEEKFYKEEVNNLQKLDKELQNKISSIELKNQLIEEKLKLLGDLLTKN